MDTGKKSSPFQLGIFCVSVLISLLILHNPASIAEISAGDGIIQQELVEDSTDEMTPFADSIHLSNKPRITPGNREIRVGLYENMPKIYTGENGQASGIFIGILEAIAQRENWSLTYVSCSWADGLAYLEDGRIDLMPDVAFSPERNRNLDFHTEVVLESWSQIYANSKNPAKTWSELNGRRIALLKDSIQQTFLEQISNGLGYKISIVDTNTYEEAFTLAAKGIVDAVVSNHLFGNYYYQEYGLVLTPLIFNPVSLFFATRKGANKDLLEAIDRNLREMKAESGSVYYTELGRWMERPLKMLIPRYFVWFSGGIGGMLVFTFVLILLLRAQVRARTNYLVIANETLRQSEEKFRSLFQDHSAVKLIIDPDNGNIVEANDAAVRFYGWPADQLRRMRIQDINIRASEQTNTEIANINSNLRNNFTFSHRLADNSIRDVEIFSSRIDLNGKILVHYVIHDITEHRKLEEQYRQAQKMESVGRLAGGVAHDFNNMLSVILGYSELAMESVDKSDPLHTNLLEIFNSANRAAEITRQLLAFARKQTINPRVIDLNTTVESILKMLRRLIGEDIDLAWLPGSGTWPVMIDPSQVDQILANLCVNARDAITGVGKVTIETHNITLDEEYCADHADSLPGDFVLLEVSDDGCGMDSETLDHAFEPFFTTKNIGKGTGLGLATVYGIIKQNNGFINVYTELGKGTTFKIYLPRNARETDRVETYREAEIPVGQGETVLLVEDDASLLRLTTRILEELGYIVLGASTPNKAIEITRIHAGGIQLLLTDVVMPEMNGRELAGHLQTILQDFKVLYMSGYTTNVIAHRGVLDSGVQFIQKPFTKKDLAIKMHGILKN